MHRLPHSLVICLLSLFLMPYGNVQAGKLDSFEKSAAQERERDDSRGERRSDSCIADILGDIIVDILGHGMLYGGATSWARVTPSSRDCPTAELTARDLGDPQIPFMRLDFGFQDVESDIDAYDYRVECGYGPLGLHFDQTHYRETSTSDELDLIRLYGLYRMSFGARVQIDLGLGALTIDGDDRDSRFSFTMPILIYPSDHVGIEVRPAWAGNITDYDVGLLATWRYSSIKVGYRWVKSPEESLDGPYVGLSVHF